MKKNLIKLEVHVLRFMLYKSVVKLILIGIVFLTIPFLASADYFGQKVDFSVDSSYDAQSRTQISASLKKIFARSYFYVDEIWWNSLNPQQKDEMNFAISALAEEFDSKIYPVLTFAFGSESKPGIDKDERVTILVHPMIEEAGGYFRNVDNYSKFQVPGSNEREMIYLNSKHINKTNAKGLLAHEFFHLITINQKDLVRGVSEDTWLNEARAEYAPTLLGYDTEYKGSNLERRVKNFLEKPTDSLTEWLNLKYDYAAVNLFIQYLVDHYGVKILVDSLWSDKVGIESLNYALKKNNFKEDFFQIFTNWTIAVLINNCDIGEKYCYLNPNLKSLKIPPAITYLPLTSESYFSASYMAKNWAGNWFKIVGGKGNLTFEFEGNNLVNFKIPYVVCDYEENCSVNFLLLDKEQKGELILNDFNTKYGSLIIIPSIQNKISGFNGPEPSFVFSWKTRISQKTSEEEKEELIKQLLSQIDFLKAEIAKVRAKINAILVARGELIFSCQRIENNLYFGMRDSDEVRCLQEFLKARGTEIYPEGLITGNFLSLTQQAVIRFQEKHASEILAPFGLSKGTGFVGEKTRAKINQLIY